MPNNYIFFDGSSLISEIRAVQGTCPQFRGKRLVPTTVVSRVVESLDYLGAQDMNSSYMGALSYRRATFYFADNDPQVEEIFRITELRD